MIIQKRSMGWLPRPSAYNELAAANARRKAANESFLGNQSSFLSAIGNINSNLLSESTNFASQAAAKRLGLKLK